MGNLYLMCGLPCSGKTTEGRRLESTLPGVLLSADEWMSRLELDGHNQEKRALVEAQQWTFALRLLELGMNVIIDWGVWSRNERDSLRRQAASKGAQTKIIYMNIPMEELRQRLEIRNTSLPEHTFRVSHNQLEQFAAVFEPPAAEELE